MGVRSDDQYHSVLQAAAIACLEHGVASGRAVLGSISGEIWGGLPPMALPPERRGTGSKGRSFAARRSAEVYRRDGFQCRYCGRCVMPRPIAELMATLFPEDLAFHTHYKSGCVHPVFWTRVAEADHIFPGSLGGDWDDPMNHATACVACNVRKSNYTLEDLGWQLVAGGRDAGWDGMVALYPKLWRVAGHPRTNHHRKWLRAFGFDTSLSSAST